MADTGRSSDKISADSSGIYASLLESTNNIPYSVHAGFEFSHELILAVTCSSFEYVVAESFSCGPSLVWDHFDDSMIFSFFYLVFIVVFLENVRL